MYLGLNKGMWDFFYIHYVKTELVGTFPKIDKRVLIKPCRKGKNPKKGIRNVTLLIGTSELGLASA